MDHCAELEQEAERSREEAERMLEVSKELGAELERYKDELQRYKEEIEDLKYDNEAKVRDHSLLFFIAVAQLLLFKISTRFHVQVHFV